VSYEDWIPRFAGMASSEAIARQSATKTSVVQRRWRCLRQM